MRNGRTPPERANSDKHREPPGDFISEELRKDTARFLDELRRRAEQKRRRLPRKKPGPPPKET
jgi:hypothetical protein